MKLEPTDVNGRAFLVSIHTRSEDQVKPPEDWDSILDELVSIHTRSEDQVKQFTSRYIADIIVVSIHTRSEDQVKLLYVNAFCGLNRVSIHTRSEDQVKRFWNIHMNIGMKGFDPHPVRRPGETKKCLKRSISR